MDDKTKKVIQANVISVGPFIAVIASSIVNVNGQMLMVFQICFCMPLIFCIFQNRSLKPPGQFQGLNSILTEGVPVAFITTLVHQGWHSYRIIV